MRFVILRKSDATMESNTPASPELIEAMRQYDDEMRKAGVLVAVERLQPTSRGSRVQLSKGQFATVDGPFSESKELIAARAGITLTGPVLGDLPAATKVAVFNIVAPAQLKIEAYQEGQRLQGKAIDPVQMVRLREEPLVPLASVLEPPAYEEFVLRYSPAAQQLREMMKTMELGPEQFRSLYLALSGIIGQPVFFYAGSDAALLKQQQQLAAQSEAVIKTTLGEPLYAAYQLNQDPVYRSSQTLAQQLALPVNMVMPIYQINRATQAEMDRIRNDDTLSNDEKVEALAQTQVQEQQSLQQLLGPDAFQRWLQAQGQK